MKEPQVKQAFARMLVESGLDGNFLAAKLRSLVDAKTKVFAQQEGRFTDEREVDAHETQRKTVELICRLAGHLKPDSLSSGITIQAGAMQLVVAQMQAARSNGAT